MERQMRAASLAGKDAGSWFAVILLSLLSASRADAAASPVAGPEQTDFERTRLLLLELWPRVLVAANVDTAETGTGLEIQYVSGGAALTLSRERTEPGFVMRINRDFVAENDRLIEGMLVARHLNRHDMFPSFALDRAAALAATPAGAAVPVTTFSEFVGWNAHGFALVRNQTSFREAAAVARRQGFTWLLARVIVESRLPLREETPQSTESLDKQAARLTFEISASPFPPLPTGLLTAALEHPQEGASAESIACTMAVWLTDGIKIMPALPYFGTFRLERDIEARRLMDNASNELALLRDRGRCATPL